MGGPMAANLLKAGYDVVGFNRSRPAVDRLVEQGGRGASTVAEAVRDADVVLTMLPDSPDVESVVTGEDGVLSAAPPRRAADRRQHHPPDVAVRVADAAREPPACARSTRPVSGGEAGAVEGTLSIMVGGEAADVAAARPVLEAVGTTVVHVGPSGSGQTVKAANQLIVAGTIELVAEALVFLEAYGVDTEAAVEVLAGGLAGNRILDRKAAGMIAREFAPGFRVDLHHKDLGIVTSAAREAGRGHPARRRRRPADGRRCAPMGHGSLDHSALLLLVEQLSGRATALPPCRQAHSPTPARTAASRALSQEIPMPRMRAVDAAVAIMEREGATQTFGLPGAAINPFYAAMKDARRHPPRPGPPRRGRLAHGRGLHPRPCRQHRRLRRHLGPGRHRHDHRAVLRLGGLDPDPVHHRPGAGRPAAQGGLPGRRHRLDRRPGHQDGDDRPGARAGARARSRRRST